MGLTYMFLDLVSGIYQRNKVKMMERISGFLVLRKPDFNYDEEGRGAFLPYAPKIGELYYAGIDRMAWFDIDEEYYSKELPDDILQLRNELDKNKLNYTDFKLMLDFKNAKKLLEYSNKRQIINELVTICSEKIGSIDDGVSFEINSELLGVDLYCHGYGSIVREGIFTKPELFTDFSDRLNAHGLFNSDDAIIDNYIDFYVECSKSGVIEPIDGAESNLEKVLISRVAI